MSRSLLRGKTRDEEAYSFKVESPETRPRSHSSLPVPAEIQETSAPASPIRPVGLTFATPVIEHHSDDDELDAHITKSQSKAWRARLLHLRKKKPIAKSMKTLQKQNSVYAPSFRSQRRPEPPRSLKAPTLRPLSTHLPHDLDTWKAEVEEESKRDAFTAVNPYALKPKFKRRSMAASVTPALKVKGRTGAGVWATPLEYDEFAAPPTPMSSAYPFAHGSAHDLPERPVRPGGDEQRAAASTVSRDGSSVSRSYHSVRTDNGAMRNEKPDEPDTDVQTPGPFHRDSVGNGHTHEEKPLPSIHHQHPEDSGHHAGNMPLPNTSPPLPTPRRVRYTNPLIYAMQQAHLYVLFGLPALYNSRVTAIFNEANIGIVALQKRVVASASAKQMGEYRLEDVSDPAYNEFEKSWQHFVDTLMREWKTLNITSVLLLSAILSLLQIDSANGDPIVHYLSIYSLISALVSLLLGTIYTVRFNTMRKPHKAMAWASETQRELRDVGILWNIWILLALPAVWLAWSIILYVTCIVTFLWRGDANAPPEPLTYALTLAARCVGSSMLALAVIYFIVVARTFVNLGAPLDRRFKERVEEWQRFKRKANNSRPMSGHFTPTVSMAPSSPSRRSYTTRSISTARESWRPNRPPPGHRPTDYPAEYGSEKNDKEVRFHGLSPLSDSTFGQSQNPPDVIQRGLPLSVSPTPYTAPVDPVTADTQVPRSDTPPSAPVTVHSGTQATSPSGSGPPRFPQRFGSLDSAVGPGPTSAPVQGEHPLVSPSSYPYRRRRQRHNTFGGTDRSGSVPRITFAPASAGSDPSHANVFKVSASDPAHEGFFNVSPHPVWYRDKEYPTAEHLLEAMKFIKDHPHLAEQIRLCPNGDGIAVILKNWAHRCRPDWDQVFSIKMERVVYLKFAQNAVIRAALMATYPLTIQCNDDCGQPGHASDFGPTLMRVRARLLASQEFT